MKKFACLALGAVMVLSAQTAAFAAGSGTVSDPKSDLPHTGPVSMKLEGTDITEALTIECTETSGDTTNTLRIPTKASITAKISIAAGTRLRINNDSWYDNTTGGSTYTSSYNFEAGKKYVLVLEDTNGNIGQWELAVPGIEKDPPVMTMTGPNLSEKDGQIISTGNGYLSKDVSMSLTDATGIKCVYWIPYTNKKFEEVDTMEAAEIYYDDEQPDLYPTGDIVYNGTTVFSKGSTPKPLSDFGNVNREQQLVRRINAKHRFDENSNVLIVLEDVLGNQSKFQVTIEGISQIQDSEPPKVSVDKKDTNYESDGKTIKSIVFNVTISDQPAGLKEISAKVGDKELFNMDALEGKATHSAEFTVNASDKDKVLQVKAEDINGNKVGHDTAYTVDLSSHFGSSGDDSKPDDSSSGSSDSGSSGSSDSSQDKVKPSYSASYNKTKEDGKVTKVSGKITFTSPNGLKHVEIYNGSSKLVNSDISNAATTATFDYSLDVTVSNKVLRLVAEDTKGNKMEETLDLTDQFEGNSGSSGSSGSSDSKVPSKIKSNSDLKKALGDPEFEYDDDETVVTFTLDKAKTGNIQTEWTLKNPNGKTLDESDKKEIYKWSYTFEKGDDKPGDYKIRVEDEDGHKTEKTFYVDYRDDSDVAQALKIEKDLDEEAKKVTISMSLDKDKIDDRNDAKWTMYKGSDYNDIEKTESGASADFEVKKDGTYYFKVKCDGETYKFKVLVDEFDRNDIDTDDSSDKDSSDKDSSSSGSSDSSNKGEKPQDTTPDDKIPQPVGTPVVSNITGTTQTITITLNDWNKEDWKIASNSFPSGVAYTQPSGTNDIVLTVPNQDAVIDFVMENVKTNKQIKLTVKTYAKNTDGSDKNINVSTGGVGSAGAAGGVGGTLAYDCKPLDLTFRRRRREDGDMDEGNDFID